MRNIGNPFQDSDYSWTLLDSLWYQVKQLWRDDTRVQFERLYWLPLEGFMEGPNPWKVAPALEKSYLPALRELVETIDEAEKATRHLQ